MTDGELVVSNVPPSGPGYDAGLMPDDTLLALDDEQIIPPALDAWLNQRRAGDVVELTIVRGGRFLTIPVRLREDHERIYKILEEEEEEAGSDRRKRLRESWLGSQ